MRSFDIRTDMTCVGDIKYFIKGHTTLGEGMHCTLHSGRHEDCMFIEAKRRYCKNAILFRLYY